MRKTVALFILIILTLLSLPILPLCSAIPKPAIPEFSLEVSLNRVDHQAIYEIDPYTGKNVTVTPAYSDEWTSVVVTIKNQPFTPYTDSDGNQIKLFYNIRSKGHFEEAWIERENVNNGYVAQSNTKYTIREYLANYSSNVQIDFQVEGMIGYIQEQALYGLPDPYYNAFIGESSGWSSTKTIAIDENSSLITPSSSPLASSPVPTASSSQNPTVTPIQPVTGESLLFGLGWVGIAIVVLLGIIAVLLVFVVMYLRRRAVK